MTDKQHDAAADLLIKEVDEDLRQEQLARHWRRHGPLLVGVAVVAVVAVVAWQGWRNWEAGRSHDASAHYQEIATLLDQGKRDSALAELTRLSADGPEGYALLAKFRLADLHLQQNDPAAAAKIFRDVAENSGTDQVYRDIALIRLGYLTLDSDDPAKLTALLDPLARESSAWRHSAREIQALAAMRQGDTTRAGALFARIAEDGAAPQGIRARAAEMLSILGPSERS